MFWVDHQSYFGPDRRRVRGGLRLRERRRYDYAGPMPPLRTALRQLRMRVIEARGPGAATFAERSNAVALLAEWSDEPEAACELSSLAVMAGRNQQTDMRPQMYASLDRAHMVLRSAG